MIRQFICVFLLTFTAISAEAQISKDKIIDEIIAVVGDEIVLKSDLEGRKTEMKNEGFQIDPEAECAVVEELLYQKLLINQAKIDSLEVTDDEVESQLERRLEYYISQFPSEKDFEKFYGKTASQLKEDFRPEVKDQILTQKMQGEITQNVRVTPNEVTEYFNSIPKDSLPLIESEVQYSQIVINPEVQKDQEKSSRKVPGLVRKIKTKCT